MRQASARRLVRRPSIEALKFRPTVFAFEDRTLPGQAMGLFESFVLGGALATPGLLGQKQSRISAGEAKVSEIAITSKKQKPAKTEGSASTLLAAATEEQAHRPARPSEMIRSTSCVRSQTTSRKWDSRLSRRNWLAIHSPASKRQLWVP